MITLLAADQFINTVSDHLSRIRMTIQLVWDKETATGFSKETHFFLQGSLKYCTYFGGDETIQIYGNFEGFLLY